MALFTSFATITCEILYEKHNNMVQINIIVAVGKNRVIGKNNDLVWKDVPGDLKKFKEITTGHPVIMGRKTFESIGSKALMNRTNVIITRNQNFHAENCIICSSLEKAIEEAEKIDKQIFIIGGGEIYNQAMRFANRLYLTLIDAETDGDVFFPDYSEFTKIISSENMPATEKFPYRYKFVILEK
jgi:dihydrofolate reductase